MSYKHWQLRTLLIPHLHWLTWLDCSAVELCVRPIFPANCGLHSWVLPGTGRVKIRITGCPSHANQASRMPSLAAVTETDDNMNIHEPTSNHRPSKDVSNTYHQQTCNFDKCSCVNFHSQRSGSQPPNLAWKAKGLPGSIATSSLALKKWPKSWSIKKTAGAPSNLKWTCLLLLARTAHIFCHLQFRCDSNTYLVYTSTQCLQSILAV